MSLTALSTSLQLSLELHFHQAVSTGDSLSEMKAAGKKLEKDWIKSADARGLDGAMLVKTAKDLIAKYDK